MEFYTIGVYNSTEEFFFKKLTENKIDLFCDIRQRRGVRGAKYAFVNSSKLQESLKKSGIKYIHIKELAPTSEIRNLQKQSDLLNSEQKRDRNKLSILFTNAYTKRVLDNFSLDSLILQFQEMEVSKIVLFCVEEKNEACHRSIVANRLKDLGYKVVHL